MRRLPNGLSRPVLRRSRPALPTFLVIGTMKGGTSSLHHYLASHPDIAMSDPKETNYFLPRGPGDRSLDWYRSLFDGRRPVRGESSPNYTKRRQFDGVPERASLLVPRARLVYLVRDPVARTRSHFQHAVVKGRRRPDELEDLLFPRSGVSRLLDASSYHRQLTAWLVHWSMDDVLVVGSEDLRHDRHATIARIYRFLGADPTHVSSTFDVSVHRTADKLAETGAPSAPFPDDVADRVREILAPDVERLRALTGQSFASWSL